MESEQFDPHGSILCMGPPLASAAAVLPIARLGRALFSCLPRAHGARHYFFPPRARGARRFSARRTALPCTRPAAALPCCRPGRGPAFAFRRGPAFAFRRGPALLPPPLRPCLVLGFGGGEYGVMGVCGLPCSSSSSSVSHCCSCR
ncbi:unnamed protein product [Closterium sp. NIES-54]